MKTPLDFIAESGRMARSDDVQGVARRGNNDLKVTIFYSNTRPPSGFQRIDRLPVGSVASLSE
jgi:hypothetical protein